MTYGYEVKGRQDRKMVVPKQLSEFSSKKVARSAWLLNGFPFRMYPHRDLFLARAHAELTVVFPSTPYPRLDALY